MGYRYLGNQCHMGNEKIFLVYLICQVTSFFKGIWYSILDNKMPYNNDDGMVERIIMAVKNNILNFSGDLVKTITT